LSQVYLGLGTNLGNRRANLIEAVKRLQTVLPLQLLKISPIYENPALLPEFADAQWNRPFSNLVVSGECDKEPLWLFGEIKKIEKEMGRQDSLKWAPRIIDIDILIWDGVLMNTETLTIPHRDFAKRSFVLDPLKDLLPEFCKKARLLPQHSPLWMAILNVTPDSFSDGGKYLSLEDIDAYLSTIENHVGIIDLGAESTRPGAKALSWEEEWLRLESVLKHLKGRYGNQILKPIVSVDTRHGEVASRALDFGVEIINDVSGASDHGMTEILKSSLCQYVLTHSLSIPADSEMTIPRSERASLFIKTWFEKKLAEFVAKGISAERVILDPGIGFGKDSLQSLDVLRNIEILEEFPCRILVGHSRKSFINDFSKTSIEQRDLESIGISLSLAGRGVDILRVHNPLAHIKALSGFKHVV
jgi:2-amino-4-hydroxy-6-hydroxymethyldihydropteridine diphosphokinase/dihydropteroate synthase